MQKLAVSLALVVVAASCAAVDRGARAVAESARAAEVSESARNPSHFPGVDPGGEIDPAREALRTRRVAPERQAFVDDANARLDAVIARVADFTDKAKESELPGDLRDDAHKAALDLRAEAVALKGRARDSAVVAGDDWSTTQSALSADVAALERRIDDLDTQLSGGTSENG